MKYLTRIILSGWSHVQLVICLYFVSGSFLYAQLHPVSAHVIMNPITTPYLLDYLSFPSHLMEVNLVFNDYNEPQWPVYLRFTLEGANCRIRSAQHYKPVQPVYLYPGEATVLRADDLAPYFKNQHLDVAGISRKAWERTGRLPEGFYTITVEVLDYQSGKVLSNLAHFQFYATLYDAPEILSPRQGAVIFPDQADVSISWQLKAPVPVHVAYTVELYEITDKSIDPTFAIPAGGAIKVWQQEAIQWNQLFFSTTDYPLEEGKTYAYHVIAENSDKQLFKNSGVSQSRYFYYGYPQGGHIELLSPEDNHAFSQRESGSFSWTVPDQLLPGQPVSYELYIAENTQVPTKEITRAMPVFKKKRLPPGRSPYRMFYQLDSALACATDYLWQVKAFSHETEIAASDVYACKGPPIMESFYAGRHRVWVKEIQAHDSIRFSGVGEVQVNTDGSMQTVYFDDIEIVPYYSTLVMQNGLVYSSSGIAPIEVSPNESGNRMASFYSDSLLITPQYMYLKGQLVYPLPWAVAPGGQGKLVTEKKRIVFDEYLLTGALRLPADTLFALLDLPDYELALRKKTVFYLSDNNYYRAVFEGSMHCSDHLQTRRGHAAVLPFRSSQLRYLDEIRNDFHVMLHPFDQINLYIRPLHYIIDLCDSLSHGKSSAAWKGIVLEHYEVIGETYFDKHKQILLDQTYRRYFRDSENGYLKSDDKGLHFLFHIDSSYNFNHYFNTFPAILNEFRLCVENSQLKDSRFTGRLRLPFISQTDWYDFTVPLTVDGFMDGYLDVTLAGRSFVHNANKEEERIHFYIQRAFFQDKERLVLTVDMDWSAIGFSLKGLHHLSLYGNYDLGFGSQNGHTDLHTQVKTQLKGFEINIDQSGAGRQANLYAVGLSGNMNMGEDVSGSGDAPPIVNLYSVEKNSLLEGEAVSVGWMLQNQDASTYQDELGSSDVGQGMAEIWLDDDFRDELSDQAFRHFMDSLQILDSLDYSFLTQNEEQSGKAESGEESDNTTPTGLSAVQRAELQKRLEQYLQDLQEPLYHQLRTLNTPITDRLQTYAGKASAIIGEGVGVLIGEAEKSAVGMMPEYEEQIAVLCQKTQVSVQRSLEEELHAWIEEDVMDTIMLYMLGSFRHALAQELSVLLVATLEEGFSYNKNLDDVLADLSSSLLDDFQWEQLSLLLEGMAHQLLGRLSAEVLLEDMGDELLSMAGSMAGSVAIKQVQHLAGEETQEKIEALSSSAVGNIAGQLANNVEMDFSNLGDKVKEGDVGGIIKFDPSLIEVKTRVADFSGYVRFFEDDPLWGDSWQAGLTARVKIKPQFEVWAEYINGSKTKPAGGTYKYWFLELGARGLGIPLSPIPLALDGAAGKVYHHMRKDEQLQYYPDPTTKFGVGLQVFMYDAPAKGNVITFDVTLEASFFEPRGFMLELYGGAQIANTIEGGEVRQSLVTATGHMGFNSLNNHFIGNFSAALEKRPLICAGGDMTVDICGPTWNVAVGTRDVPIYLRVPCAAQPVFQSWFDISNYGLDMGFVVAMSQHVESPWIGFTGAKFKPWAYFEFELGGSTILYWKPFAIEEARIWMHMGVGVGMQYELLTKIGDFTFAEVILGGELALQTVETSRVWGSMYGEVTLFSFNIGFDMSFDHGF